MLRTITSIAQDAKTAATKVAVIKTQILRDAFAALNMTTLAGEAVQGTSHIIFNAYAHDFCRRP
tara:strand:+ start:477 stop:668 length:192 start_codon:yes stop_codon:yes gene_type:complete